MFLSRLPFYRLFFAAGIVFMSLFVSAAQGQNRQENTPRSAKESARPRARDIGIRPGILPTGPLNAITDVEGVLVGQFTLWVGDSVRTGVTTVLPHGGNLYQDKVPAGFFQGNGFGKFAGSTQILELGEIETPIVLTNTLSVPQGMEGVITWTLAQPGNENVRSVNAIVGETNDGFLNDIRGRHVKAEHVVMAIENAKPGPVEEGSVGAGTGTVSFGWKGGIGTSSRKLPTSLGGFTVGALVQTNYGGILQIEGVPIGEEMQQYYLKNEMDKGDADGSVIVVLATDAPLSDRNLERLASRAMLAIGKSGSPATNGSGDYAIAFSTALGVRRNNANKDAIGISNNEVSPLFEAAVEATEEAIYNALLRATSVKGHRGTIEAISIEDLVGIMRKYGRDVNFVR
jgi:D-aminopeptidase